MEPSTAHWTPTHELPLPRVTVGDLLRQAAARVPGRTALVDGRDLEETRRWSYEELLDDSERLAAGLLHDLRPGEQVGVWCDNRPEWVVVELAVALAGLVLVPLNPLYRYEEAAFVASRVELSALLHGGVHRDNDIPAHAAALGRELGDRPRVTPIDDLDELIAGRGGGALPEVSPEDLAQIQFTSGTTGTPKGARLHHLGLAGMPAMSVQLMDLERPPVWLNVMPMFHIGGCGLSTLGPLAAAGTQVLADRFTSAGVLRSIEREAVTVFGSVPTMLVDLLGDERRRDHDLSSLEVVVSGGATVSPALVRRVEWELGARFVVAYGQTEASGHIAQTRPDDSVEDKAETVGRPLPHVEVQVVDPATGTPCRTGEAGEVWTRSPLVMQGYRGASRDEDRAIDDEGWLHTGDVCSMDGRGYLRVVGRTKELIVRGGENISPREIEERLEAHEAVAEAAVVGLPDERWGEVVAAAIRPAHGRRPDPDELAAWVRAALAPYKAPTEWRLVEDLPRTAAGKVRKHVLREGWPEVAGREAFGNSPASTL